MSDTLDPALPQSLTSDWLKSRFAARPAGADVADDMLHPAGIQAAVLVPVVERQDGLTVLLTRRTDHLHDHPGQIAFPGGRAEESDGSLVFTALREAEEEIGLRPSVVEVIGELPKYHTATGFKVTPVVGVVRPPFELILDAFEVAEVFEVPLGFFLDPVNHLRHSREIAGRTREYWAMPYHDYYIWGATAGMLVSFYRFLFEADR